MYKIKVSNPNDNSPKKSKHLIWQTFVEVYNEFAAETSIHGLKYTTQRKLKLDGFIWLTIVCTSIVCAGLLASRFYERHHEASMRTTVVSTQYPSWDLKLPAVTLCHGTMATQRKLEMLINERGTLIPRGMTYKKLQEAVGYIREAIEPTKRFVSHIGYMQLFMDKNAMSMLDFLKKISPNCSDYLKLCRMGYYEVSCDSLMSQSLSPYGLCCSFNYRLALGNNKRNKNEMNEDYHSVTYGTDFALSFLIDPLLDDRLASSFYGDGVKVLIHEPLSYPGSASIEFVAPSGYETIANVYGNRLISSGEVLALKEDVRGCVDAEEFVPPYRVSNCYAECREQVIRTACLCQLFYSYSHVSDVPFCNFTDISCILRNMFRASSLKLEDPNCQCSSECTETTYSIGTTTIPLNAPAFNSAPIYGEASKYPNATILHVTLASQMMKLQRRDVVQSWINLLSSLGGVFSLFLGCSFISVIEIIYFFCFRLPNKLRLIGKQKSESKVNQKRLNLY